MSPPPYRRRRKLIQPGLQLRLTFTFVGISALSLLLQFVLFANAITNLALELPRDGAVVMERSSGLLGSVLLVSFLVFLPLTFGIGVLATFRIAGPVYRFKAFLSAVLRGERPPDFHLRKGDELQDLAELMNVVTEPLRRPSDAPARTTDLQPEVRSLVGDAAGPGHVAPAPTSQA